MRIQRAWLTPLMSLASLVIFLASASGQVPGQAPGAAPYPLPPAHGVAPPMPGYGPYAMPAQYMNPYAMNPYGMTPYGMNPLGPEGAMVDYQEYADAGNCPSCNGYGCNACRKGLLPKLGQKMGGAGPWGLGPFADGSCCAPRWFDIHVEGMYLTREDVSRQVDFTSAGIGGPIVLSTENLDFDPEVGFRITAAYQTGPGSNLEFSYFGTFNWASADSVESANDILFSTFSDFGTDPFGGFLETDQAARQAIEYSTSFDSLELDYRRRWASANCRFQGSWLMGVRYLKLDEQFIYQSRVDRPDPAGGNLPIRANMDYFVGTSNDLTGFQVGGDIWGCIFPGLRVGSELKAGIYGNHATQRAKIQATTIDPDIVEALDEDDVAFIGEAGLMFVYRLNYQVTLRAGYQFLYINGLALAPENFNSNPPNVFTPPPPNSVRTPFINTGGDAFYHGYTAGLEYMW